MLGILIDGLAIVVPAIFLLFRTFCPAAVLRAELSTGEPSSPRNSA